MRSLTTDQKRLFRELKGAPLTILLVILVRGGFAQNKDLYFLYNDRTVAKSLEALRDAGLVTKITAGWQLTQGGQQLALYFQNDPQQLEEEVVENTTFELPEQSIIVDNSVYNLREDGRSQDWNAQKVVKSTIFEPKVVKNTIFRPPTTTALNNNLICLIDLSSSSTPPKVVDNTTFPENSPHCPLIDLVSIRLLREAGIGDPVRSELAALPHATPDYLEAIIADWKNDRDKARRRPGLLITRIRSGDLPVVPRLLEHDPSRYTGGEYADFIDH